MHKTVFTILTIILIIQFALLYQTRTELKNTILELSKEQQKTKKEQEVNQQIQRVEYFTELKRIETELNKSISKTVDKLKESETKVTEVESKLRTVGSSGVDFSTIIRKSFPSVVSIRTDKGSGSGAITHSAGYVITNYHVIKDINAGQIMTYDKQRYQFRIAAKNQLLDLALLKIISDKSFTSLDFSKSILQGEKVVSLGSPGGLDFTSTEGTISSTERTSSTGIKYIQTDVAINPGNSGGPIINKLGQIVGITTMKISSFEGIGFAIHPELAENFVKTSILEDVEINS